MASKWEEMKRRNLGNTEENAPVQNSTGKSAWEAMKERALQREAAVPPSNMMAPIVPTVTKTPDMNQLMQMRQQAQIDLDVDTVNRIDNQLKALRAQQGKQTVLDRLGDTTGAAAAGYFGNVSNALGTAAESLGAQNFAQKAKGLADIADEDTQRFTQGAKKGLGALGQFAVDAGIMGGQMALDAAAGALVPFGGRLASGIRAFGGGAKEARDAGATQEQQMAYGGLTAATSLLTESIANVSGLFKGTYGKGILDKALSKVTAKPGGKLILSALSEGGEEMLESAIQPLLQRMTYDPDAAYDEDWLTETLYSGALGAVLGGFGGGVDVVTGRGETRAEAKEMPKTASAPLNLEGVTPERRKAFTQAQKIAERFGATLNVAALENGAGGRYLNGQITIDPNTENPVRQVLVHELTHHMETSGLYQDFSREIMDYMQRDMGIDLDDMRLQIMEDYAARGTALDSDGADRELVAKFAEDMLFRDEKAVRRLLEKDRNLFQRIYDWIRTAKVRLKGTDEERFLMEAESLYERALQQAGSVEGSEEAQFAFADKKIPTYEELVRKKNIPVVDIRNADKRPFEVRREELKSNVEKLYNEPIINNDTGELVFVTKNTLTHSFSNKGAEQIDAIEQIRAIVKNAVLTHAEPSYKQNDNTTGVYTLFGAVRTETGVQPVKIKVKEYNVGKQVLPDVVQKYMQEMGGQEQYASVYDNRVLVVEGIEKEDPSSSAASDAAYTADYHPSGSSEISVEDLMGIVNKDYQKYLPQKKSTADPYDIMPKLEGQFAQGRGFRDLYQKQQKDTKEWHEAVLDSETSQYDIMPKLTASTIPAKAKETLTKTENALLRRIGRALSVPVGVQRSDLKELVRSISNEYLRDGKVSQESLDTLFDEAYERGIETDTEYYDQHKDIKNILRTTAIKISAEDQSNITDYNDFRKAAMGTLRISNDGTPVDVVYSQLSEQDPSLFPESITHPADQLQRMFEVGRSIQKVEKTLNDYYGEDAETFKAWAKRDFNDAVNGAMAELNNVRRFAEEAARKQATKMTNTPEQVKEAYEKIRAARKKRERAVGKNLLIDRDNAQVSRLLKSEIQLSDLDPKRYNVKGIREVYEAKLEYEQIARVIREYKKQHSQQLRDEAEVLLKSSVNWKDKKAGALYSRETMERNIRDIVPDPEVAAQIIRKYFAPVHSSQAASNRAKNAYRDRVKKLGLSRKVAQGNEVSEAHAVQLLGEAEDNIRMLQNSKEKNHVRDGQTLQEWNLTVQKLKHNNPNMDWAKVDRAVNEFRAIYDELFQKMNEVRLRNGYEPVAYRQGYFPHFQPGETGLLASFGTALGITTDVTDLPTSINGMTHTFKPGITYFGHAQERKGFNTAYDAVQGFDKYIEGAADVIYQTDNIQRLRALANQIRYRAGDEGLKKQIDEINANENLTEDQKQAAIEQTHKEGGFALSNFVVELEEYTNLLANKKSRHDRNMEQAMGRRMYNIIKGLEGRVAANMVAVNPGSWLTNFIPITQGMASLNTKALLSGMWDTLKAYKTDDGMVELSTFLTNRRGSDPLVKTLAQDWSAKASKPMEWIDSFTADTLVRSRYNQNISEGMSVNEALDEADAWAAKVMADRSKGSMPTVFNRHNPITKVFTQFQLEVNNQMSYLFKDVPDEMKEKGLKALAVALMKMFVGAYLYNEVYEHFIGRRPALDPIGILIETGKNIAGEEMDAYEVAVAAGTDVVENLPFVGGLIGGGRLPISSALPDPANLGKALLSDDWDRKKKLQTIGKEALAPATYLLAPFGGGQAKKLVQGVNAVRKGGSYTVNSRGEDVLQYPILSDTAGGKALDYLQAGVFGKSSLPEAQDWVKQGFNSLSGKETETYKNLTAAGEDGRTSFDLLQELGDVEGTKLQSESYLKRNVLREADLSDEGKSILYYNMLANDAEKELMDAASAADREKSAGLLMDMKDADLRKGDAAKKAKYYALLESNVSDEMKIAVYNKYVTDSKEEEIRNMLDQGVKFNDWLQFEAKTGNLSSDDDATRKEKVIGALQDLNVSEEKKAAMYFASAATDSDKEKQQELEASSGITRTQYWQYQQATAGMTKKAEKLVAIHSLDLTPDQKTALYFANRWAESTLDEAPWYRSSRWDIMPKLTGTSGVPQTVNGKPNPFLVMPKL